MAGILTASKHGFATGPDRFGRAFLVALAIEVALASALLLAPKPLPPVPPSVVELKLLQPAPLPAAKPPPPKPPPPVPAPALPAPLTPPVPKPLPAMAHRPSARHLIRHAMQPHPPPPAPPPAPASPAPVTAPPPPSPVAEQSAMSRYIGELRAIVLSNLVVPQQLIDSGLEGDCVLEFTLAPDGSLVSVEILTPSALQRVNEAALDALRAASLPAFLPDMPQRPLVFTLPVHVAGGPE